MSEINIEKNRRELPLNKALQLIIGSLLLGVFFNVLFYKQIPALSCFLFTVAFYILYFITLSKKPSLKLNIENFLLVTLALLALNYAVHSNMVLFVLNLLIVPILIIAHTILNSRKNSYSWYTILFISDLIIGMLTALFSNINKPFTILYRLIAKKEPSESSSPIKKILLGLLISVPLLFIIISLLVQADAVFRSLINNFSSIFQNINFNSIMTQAILILFIAIFSFSYIYSMLSQKKLNTLDEVIKPNIATPFGDPIIVVTVLSVLSVVYLIFIYIQFTYLFGSVNMKLPDNLTYATYARKGFFELVGVTLLNVLIIIYSSTRVKNNDKTTTPLLKIINSVLVLFTLIMLFSAHFRMNLYEKVYGYTYLRFFTHYFMLYIALILIPLLIRIWYKKITFSKYLIVISLIAYIVLNYINVDKIVIKNNIAHYNKTGTFDVTYISTLSYDSIPELVKLYNTTKSNHPYFEKDLYNLLSKKKHQLEHWNHIQSYNYSASKARNLLNDF